MTPDSSRWPVDAHVHFHGLSCVSPTLDAAARNMGGWGIQSEALLGALLLAQSSSERVFEALSKASTVGRWSIEGVEAEPETLVARTGDEGIAIVCGRQVRALDGLEVLALGTRQEFPDGLEFPAALDAVRASGALPVIPWGFGKWLGERGRRVASALDTQGPRALFLGDNGGRLAAAGLPPLLYSAGQRGFRILPGTDPFPFAQGYRRVGQFGFLAGIEPSMTHPWRDLRRWLLGLEESPPAFGSAMGLTEFIFNQVGIQLYSRLRRARQP